MRRDPESVYRSKPKAELPLFEQVSPRTVRDGGMEADSRRSDLPGKATSGLSADFGDGAYCETGQQGGLVGHKPTAPLKAFARRTDPRTSHEAAASVRGTEQVRRNIKFILEQWGVLTDEEIAAYYALGCRPLSSPSGLRTRRSELVAAGEVVAAGIGTTRSGRNCTTWRLK